jgi:hypothetical protein
VQVLERSQIRYFETADTLQDLFRQSGRGFEFRGSTKLDGIAVANQEQYLLVLGAPGIGKSTFLRKVGLEALKGQNKVFRHACIPVLIELRKFDASRSVTQLLIEEFETCGFPQAAELTHAFLEKGKLLILLDGLDEVPAQHQNLIIDQIQDLVDRHSQNRFIASCRIAAYKGGFNRFKDVIVAAFEDDQIEEFIHHWFATEPTIVDACWSLLKQPEYAAAKELAQTPLLLTLLCIIYDESQDFPKNRAAVYGEALDVLLRKWSAEKRLQRNPIYKELSPELEQILLSEIAYDSFASDRLFFSKSEVVKQIREFLVTNLNAPKHLDGEAVLEAIEVQQGLLVERARDTYSFSHLTLQEYLTAKYIVDNNQISWLVENHNGDRNWQEVFLLVAGQMSRRSGADALLLTMEKQVRSYIYSPKLLSFLCWADEVTADSEGNYKPVMRRAGMLGLAYALARVVTLDVTSVLTNTLTLIRVLDSAHAFGLALDLARAFDLDHTIDLTSALDLASRFKELQVSSSVDFSNLATQLESFSSEISNYYQIGKVAQVCNTQIQQLWFKAIKLDPEIADLSEKEKQALATYLYINYSMVRCKEAAVRVSAETWEAIESRMLKV